MKSNKQSQRESTGSGPNRGQPGVRLAANPLFPAIVALWVAALLAIGGLAIPAGLLERAAAALHLDQLVPAARPPLGLTARLLVAFALALAGGMAGYLAARLLAARAAAPGRPSRAIVPAAPPRSDALCADGTTAPDAYPEDEDLVRLAAARVEAPQRRRGLTAETGEGASSSSILEISALSALEPLGPEGRAPAQPDVAAPAPPPEPSVHFRSLARIGSEAAQRLRAAPLDSLGVVQLVERFALALGARREAEAKAAAETATETGQPAASAPAAAPLALPEAAPVAAAPAEPAPFAQPPAPGELRAEPSGGRPFDMPAEAVVRPAPQLMPDLMPELAREPAPEPEPEPTPPIAAASSDASATFEGEASEAASAEPESPGAPPPLLRVRMAAPYPDGPAPLLLRRRPREEGPDGELAATPPASLAASLAAPGPAEPAIRFEEVYLDDDEDDDTDPEAERARWALPEPDDEGEDIDEDLTPDPGAGAGYSSLLDMRPSTRIPPPLADFVRVDEEGDGTPPAELGAQPVVVFPGQAFPAPPIPTRLPGMDAPATAQDTDQALRQALAALQRMSGAA